MEENEEVVAYALRRRSNVRLVETGLPFGKEGFTNYMGKKFDASLRLTRRFYPHHQNVDGFFVAKFKKIGPTPANAVLAKGFGAKPEAQEAGQAKGDAAEADVVDKSPITDEAKADEGDDFGGFEDEEDAAFMEKARKNAMRRRGIDPRAINGKKANGKAQRKAQ